MKLLPTNSSKTVVPIDRLYYTHNRLLIHSRRLQSSGTSGWMQQPSTPHRLMHIMLGNMKIVWLMCVHVHVHVHACMCVCDCSYLKICLLSAVIIVASINIYPSLNYFPGPCTSSVTLSLTHIKLDTVTVCWFGCLPFHSSCMLIRI